LVNKPHAFKDRDVKRIIKNVEASTGQKARRVEVDPRTGRVVVEVGDTATNSELDSWVTKRGKDARPT
jgi:hypothetical protein